MALLGLLFVAGIYPLATSLWQRHPSDDSDDMLLAVYFALGIFLLLAVRNPAAHRSLILFAGWANLAHIAVMVTQSVQAGNGRGELLAWAGVSLVFAALILLAPAKQQGERPKFAPEVWGAASANETGRNPMRES